MRAVWEPKEATYAHISFEVESKQTKTKRKETVEGDIRYTLRRHDGKSDQPLVVLVHGIGDFSYRWQIIADHLYDNGVDVLTMDLFGRGYSEAPVNFDFSGEAHVKMLRALFEALHVDEEPITLCGFSMGGGLVTLYTDLYPEHVAKLGLFSAAGLMGGGIFKVLRKLKCLGKKVLEGGQQQAFKDDFADWKTASLYEWCLEHQSSVLQHRPESFDAFFESVLNFPLSALHREAERISKDSKKRNRPVLLVWGTVDRAVPIKLFRKWADILGVDPKPVLQGGSTTSGHVRAVVYDKAAHTFFLEDHVRDAFNKEMLTFVTAP